MDILGPFRKSNRGNLYIIVFSDYLTRWVEAFAIKNQEAITAAKVLVEQIICRFGCCRMLLSDRGGAFLSKLSFAIYSLLSIIKLHTTSYHPQTNGLTERFNRTLCEMLSQYINPQQSNWDECIPYVMLAYRSSTHSTIGVSPYFALFGREARLPVDLFLQLPVDTYSNLDLYVKDMVEKLRDAHIYIKSKYGNIQHNRELWNQSLDAVKSFKVGDQVRVLLMAVPRGHKKKLMKQWESGYVVQKQYSPNTYIVSKGNKNMHVNVMRLKLDHIRVVDKMHDIVMHKLPPIEKSMEETDHVNVGLGVHDDVQDDIHEQEDDVSGNDDASFINSDKVLNESKDSDSSDEIDGQEYLQVQRDNNRIRRSRQMLIQPTQCDECEKKFGPKFTPLPRLGKFFCGNYCFSQYRLSILL